MSRSSSRARQKLNERVPYFLHEAGRELSKSDFSDRHVLYRNECKNHWPGDCGLSSFLLIDSIHLWVSFLIVDSYVKPWGLFLSSSMALRPPSYGARPLFHVTWHPRLFRLLCEQRWVFGRDIGKCSLNENVFMINGRIRVAAAEHTGNHLLC